MTGSAFHRRRFQVRRSTFIMVLFIIYLLGAHLRISLYAGGSLLLPMYPMLLSAAVITLLFNRKLLSRAGTVFAAFAGFILITPILSSAPGSGYDNTLLGILQFLVSVTAALAFIIAVSTLDQNRLRKLLIWIWITVIVLAALESAGLKPVFDQIRELIYSGSGRGVYEATQRDLSIYGRVRPTVFASEPSFLADTLMAITLMTFFLDPRRGQIASWARLGAMAALSFMLAPSFKMAFYLLAAAIWQFWPRNLKGTVTLLIGLSLAGAIAALSFDVILTIFLQTAGSHLESGSFYGRIGVAHTVGLEALYAHPLFGWGLSNQSGLYPLIAQTWQSSGAFFLFPWYQDNLAEDLMSNGFWWQLSFLGFAGTAIFILLVTMMLRQLGVVLPFRSLVCSWIVWYAGAAFVDPHSWFILVVFSVGSLAAFQSPGSRELSS
ncbi:hypothetical protein ACFMBG_22885 [Leisingera sp. D0M16]|uniref:hypothetical protein n=1 Tax=Leisingera coralii TaxID=3351347 RepID=UPI003B809F89